MKIGIDAKWYFEGPSSGKMVIRNIVDEIIRSDYPHKFYIILDKKYENQSYLFTKENIIPVFVWAKNNLLSNVFLLPYLINKFSLDIVLFQNFTSFIYSRKSIAYIHDILFKSHPQFYTFREKIYFLPLKILSNKSARIITVSNSERKRLEAYNYKKKIDVVYHGIDPIFKPINYFSCEFLENLKKEFMLTNKFILYVGRLNIRKNLYNLFKAVKYFPENIPLVIVGEQDWKIFDFQKLIIENNIKERIIFTGSLYGYRLAGIYTLASVFVFPSYAESFGLPPLEAMACGIPVVVSNSTSLPEVCGDAALYVDPNSPEDIAEKVNQILSDENLRRELIDKGLKRAKEFSWEKSVKKIIEICEIVAYERNNRENN